MAIIKAESAADIPEKYRDTPVERLICHHNLGFEAKPYENAQILVGMCMDNRKMLKLPENFAYIIRTAGANMRYSDFKIAYAIGVGGVTAVAVVGHNDCAMSYVTRKKDIFVKGMVKRAGWDAKKAEEHFMAFAPFFEIEDEETFIASEAKRIREKFPKITVAPLIYRLEDNMLYFIKEE
ncbi:MAG TPA: carbonic anhydrase [Candidatus Goldiibacteriota bacterium]|nr:carbonic anhydrase [Candidatus Goldiibacteriota bacterium]